MSKQHKVFISWSGPRSRHVAEALQGWLPMVVQAVGKPFMSDHIEKGTRSLNSISQALEGTKVGMVCLTPENLTAPWILYEAGALTKTIGEETQLCTYLIGGLKKADVPPPLGMFQATAATDKEDTRKLVHTINSAMSEEPVPESILDSLFELAWPQLESKLDSLPVIKEIVDTKRSVEDMFAEIIDTLRTSGVETRRSITSLARLRLYSPDLDTMGAQPTYPNVSALNKSLRNGSARARAILA